MRHLFLAPLGSAFGEVLHGIRLARALAAQGEHIVFLAPAAVAPLLEGAPFELGRIDLALTTLDRQLPGIVRRMRCDRVVLVDAAAVGKLCLALGLDLAAFLAPGVPVIALDCWDLPRAPVAWDYGPSTETLPAALHELPRRLVPVPVAAPSAADGYCALPEVAALSTEARAGVRGALGLADDARAVVWPTASWHHGDNHTNADLARRADALPARVLPWLARLGIAVVHVGPQAFAGAGARYRWIGQLAPRAFAEVVGACDALLGFNAVASSLALGVAARVPVVLGSVGTARAWPLDLGSFLAPLRAGNPLYTAVREADVSDEAAYLDALREVVLDREGGAAVVARQDAYAAQVRALPSAVERYLALL